MNNIKICKQCKQEFAKGKKLSSTQWKERMFCSIKCHKTYLQETGWTHTDDTKRRLSKIHTGTKKPWSGHYERTEKHRREIQQRVRMMYLERGDEIKNKISRSLIGKKRSDQSRKRMSESQKLRPTYKGGKTTYKKRACFYEKTRRAGKYLNGGNHTIIEWEKLKKEYLYTCPSCNRKEPEIKLTEDHILPLSMGGPDDISNIQPLCHSCNSHKRTMEIKYEPENKTSK